MYGIIAAFILIIGLPIAFIALTGGLFLILLPVWVIVTSVLAYVAYRAGGQWSVVSLTGTFLAGLVVVSIFGDFERRYRREQFLRQPPVCGSKEKTMRTVKAVPDILLFSDVELIVPTRPDALDRLEMIAALTGAEVIEVVKRPGGVRRTSIKPDGTSECNGKNSRRAIHSIGGIARKIDTCLTVTDVTAAADGKDYFSNRSMVSFFANSQEEVRLKKTCHTVQVVAKEQYQTLNWIGYDRTKQALRPDPGLSKLGTYGEDWLLAAVSAVLEVDLSEAAFARHLVD
jgi:hypothetical protein